MGKGAGDGRPPLTGTRPARRERGDRGRSGQLGRRHPVAVGCAVELSSLRGQLDDAVQGITHVVRGLDLFHATPSTACCRNCSACRSRSTTTTG